MHAFEHILVPTDFSEPAERAIEVALDIAAKYDAKVTLFHAYVLPALAYAAGVYASGEDFEQLDRAARNTLLDIAEKAKARWPKITTEVRFGFAPEQILAVARDLHADLVVMGTHGRRGIKHALLGSVAEQIVRTSPVPVLTVAPQSRDAQTAQAVAE